MATMEECNYALEELEAIWSDGNQNSLKFCRYMKEQIEQLSWEYVMADEDISADIEERFNILEDDVTDCWRYAKSRACECSMLGYPIGD